jgi:hypothetical protein
VVAHHHLLTLAVRGAGWQLQGHPAHDRVRAGGADVRHGDGAVPTEDGAEYFDADKFCPACVVPLLCSLLKKEFSMTDADLAGLPLYSTFRWPADVPSGATLVRADNSNAMDSWTRRR